MSGSLFFSAMDGKIFCEDYIEGTWPYVTALTSAIERYDSPAPWLEEKFADYVMSQETLLKERLEKIQYDIDAMETVSIVLRGTRIEEVDVRLFM